MMIRSPTIFQCHRRILDKCLLTAASDGTISNSWHHGVASAQSTTARGVHHLALAAGIHSQRTLQIQNWHLRQPQQLLPRRSIFIQTENTPNPESVKFVPTNIVRKCRGRSSAPRGEQVISSLGRRWMCPVSCLLVQSIWSYPNQLSASLPPRTNAPPRPSPLRLSWTARMGRAISSTRAIPWRTF